MEKLLAKAGDVLNVAKSDGFTTLHIAAINDHREIAKILLKQVNSLFFFCCIKLPKTPFLMIFHGFPTSSLRFLTILQTFSVGHTNVFLFFHIPTNLRTLKRSKIIYQKVGHRFHHCESIVILSGLEILLKQHICIMIILSFGFLALVLFFFYDANPLHIVYKAFSFC